MAMNLGEATARITLDISDLAGKSAQAQGILTGLDGAAGRTTSGFQKFGQSMLGLGTALIAPIGLGISAATSCESPKSPAAATIPLRPMVLRRAASSARSTRAPTSSRSGPCCSRS